MSKEAHKIPARIAVRTFPVDTLEANHRIKAWDEGRVDVDLDPNDPVVKAHRLNRIVIPDEKLMECLTAEEVGFSTWTRFLGGTKVTGTIMLNTETEIRLVIKLSGAERDSKAPTGMAVINTTVAEISRCLDVQRLCLPTAGRAYRTLRSALYHGNAAEIDSVQRGLENRLWQLGLLGRVKNEALKDALMEYIAVSDVLFSSALDLPDPAKALDLIQDFIAGNTTLNEDVAAKVNEERERLAAEKIRKERSIATVADLLSAREKEQADRKALKEKRAKRNAAHAPAPVEEDVAQAAADENPDQVSEEPIENDEVEAGSAEAESGSTEVPPAEGEEASTHLTEKQRRIFAGDQTKAPEAPKPKKPEAPKAETVKLDFKAALAARKAATTVAADSAPATETAPSEPAQSE